MFSDGKAHAEIARYVWSPPSSSDVRYLTIYETTPKHPGERDSILDMIASQVQAGKTTMVANSKLKKKNNE